MPLVIVEQRLDGRLDAATLAGALARNAWCRALYGVEHVESFVAADGDRLICVFRAPDAEAVRSVARRMGYPFERIWEAVHVE